MLWGMMQFTGQRPQQLPPKMKEVYTYQKTFDYLLVCACILEFRRLSSRRGSGGITILS